MVILRSQNKITDFLMILAWACPFKFRQPAIIIAVTTLSVPHIFALPANTGNSPNAVSMFPTVFDSGLTFKHHGKIALCLLD